jgi:hypothetical protein
LEEISELQKPEESTVLMYRLVAWVSGITILVVIVYGLVSALLGSGGVLNIGLTLVDVEWPFPYFAKPVTYLSISSVAFFYSSLRLWENKIAKWSHLRLSALRLFAIIVAFASAYEVLFNFMLWGAIYSVQVLTEHIRNPDIVTSPSPVPWNLVFATKMFSALFVISGYAAYHLRRVNHKKNIIPE